MDKRRRRQSKAKASCSEGQISLSNSLSSDWVWFFVLLAEVSSIEWEAVKMSEEEEDLISRMYKLVGDRWDSLDPSDLPFGWIIFGYHTKNQIEILFG